jgi:sigma-B regulation protein RsbU (phosphoserine phosphatase)
MKKPVILCIDDERIVLNSLKTELRSALGSKYRIEIAEGGHDALELFADLLSDDEEICVVISDYIMPDMKGDDLLIEIHRSAPDIIKILLTGQASLEGVTNAVNYANLYRYISKPWEVNDLILTVEEGIKSFYKDKQLRDQNIQLMNMNLVLERKVEERTKELQQKNENIQASINYAKRIQTALLPQQEEIDKIFPNNFVLYRPKDVVSGDLYWLHTEEPFVYLAAIDCTGHGVPGAFMSVIAHSLLNQIVIDKEVEMPNQILNELHKGVKKALKREEADNKEGMDISLCRIDISKNILYYAGAMSSIYLMCGGEFSEISADRCSIGGSVRMMPEQGYTLHTWQIEQTTNVYLFTDGYRDQIGGTDRVKFMSKRFREMIKEMAALPLATQGTFVENTLDNWTSNRYRQVDDILVMGVQITV